MLKHRRTLALLMALFSALALAGCRNAFPRESASPAETSMPSKYPMPSNAGDGRPALPSLSPSPLATVPPSPVNREDPGEASPVSSPEHTPQPTAPIAEEPNATGTPGLADLQEEIDRQIRASEPACVWDVWVEVLPDGESIHCTNGEDGPKMISASLIKLFIMAAVYEQAEQGKLQESDIEGKLRSMITVSDNTAANDLTALLGGGSAEKGMDAVNAYARAIGCADTEMNRLMLVDNGLQNYTSARDCAILLGMIYRGECVSAAYSEKMLELLKAQQRTSKIPAGVPKGVVTANKTGELTGLSECDAAIVFAGESPYILCILSQPEDNSAAIRRIVEISRTVYDSIAGGG